MDVNPEMQKIPLHLALAQKYDKMDSITLSSMLDRFDYVDASVWELRLYSRDERIGNMIGNYQVSKSEIKSNSEFKNKQSFSNTTFTFDIFVRFDYSIETRRSE